MVSETLDLEECLGGFRPFPLIAQMPAELRRWMLPIEWDRDRLWKIQDPGASLPIGHLRWHFDLPWWRGEDGAFFTVRPRDVLADPAKFPEQHARLTRAELRWPLHVIRRHDRWLILDGIHRAAKAQLHGVSSLDAVVVDAEDLPDFAIK